jgi:hypothetical protein
MVIFTSVTCFVLRCLRYDRSFLIGKGGKWTGNGREMDWNKWSLWLHSPTSPIFNIRLAEHSSDLQSLRIRYNLSSAVIKAHGLFWLTFSWRGNTVEVETLISSWQRRRPHGSIKKVNVHVRECQGPLENLGKKMQITSASCFSYKRRVVTLTDPLFLTPVAIKHIVLWVTSLAAL